MTNFFFKAIVKLTLCHREGWTTSRHVSTDIRMDLSPNLAKSKYLDNDLPTAEGSRMMTETLIAGLVANIHSCHSHGFRDSAEHLRHIIKELERGFVEPAEVTDSTMKEETLIDDIDLKQFIFNKIEGDAPEMTCNNCGKKAPGKGMLMCDIAFAEDAHYSLVMCSEQCKNIFINNPAAEEYVAYQLIRMLEIHNKQK